MFEVDTFSRQAIGFDRLFDVMNNIRGTDTNYPPYDIIKEDEETFIIEFALSGFKKDDLNIVVKENKDVDILMTLTTPHCPVAQELPKQIEDAVATLEEVKKVRVGITWDPPWTQDMISESGKLELGLI